jgi:hypothetical protein
MTGRTRLSWVTALTVASLLLGGGTLNALADGHGGGDKGRGSGSGNVEHQQQAPQRPAEVRHDDQSANRGNQNNNNNDDRGGANRGRDDNDKDDDDLVTPPARVTDDPRPGMGCGDRNHEHIGAPGNPDKECEDRHDGGHHDDGEDEVED